MAHRIKHSSVCCVLTCHLSMTWNKSCVVKRREVPVVNSISLYHVPVDGEGACYQQKGISVSVVIA